MRLRSILYYSLLIINYSLYAQPLSHIYPHNNAIIPDTVINFQWNTNPGAVSYNLQVATDISFTANVQNFTGLVTPNSQLPVLSSGTIYYWHVRAYNGSTYSNWTAAYKLTVFNPKILSGLKLWLAADTGVAVSGSNVTQWNDLSGNSNNATQATVGNQPTLVGNILNNKPVIRFDGSNDELLTNSVDFTGTNKATSIIVFKTDATNLNYQGMFGFPDGYSSITGFGAVIYQNKFYARMKGDAGHSTYATTNIIGMYPYISCMISDKSLSSNENVLYLNGLIPSGSYLSNNDNTNDFGYNFFNIGNAEASPFKGDIAEILVYNKALNNQERNNVENYLRYKYFPSQYKQPVCIGPDLNINYGFCNDTLDAGSNYKAYLWSTGQTTQTIGVNKNGSYWVQATDSFNVVSRDTILVTYPEIKLVDTFFCAGTPVSLNPQLTGVYTYSWSTGATASAINVSSAGQYWVTITDSNACDTISETVNVISNNFPVTARLASGNDTNLCSGNKIALIKPYPLPPGLLYSWSTGFSTSSINITSTGPYILTVTNDSGCVARDSIYVTIIGTAPNTDFSYGSQCSGDSVTFTNLSSPVGDSWNWDFGDGGTSNIANPKHLFSAGTYTVKFTVTSSGCSKDTSKQIIIKQSPTPYFNTNNACINVSYQFNDESVPASGDPITGYYWNFADGTTSNIANPQHTFSATGTYTVSLTINTTLGCTASFSKPIVIVGSSSLPEISDLVFPGNSLIVGDNIIDFVWSASKNATHYKIQVASDSTFNNIISFADVTSTNKILNLTTNAQLLYWRVKAYNICNDEMISDTFKFILFSPRTISCMKLWLSADSGVVETGSKVSQWIDRSGNSNNAIQNTLSNQPLLINNILNGKNIIRFDGINDSLSTNYVDLTNTNKVTTFLVFNTDSNFTPYQGVFGFPDGYVAFDGFSSIINANYYLSRLNGNVGRVTYLDSNKLQNSYHLCSNIYDKSKLSNEIVVYFNGIIPVGSYLSNSDNTDNFGNNKFNIGKSESPFKGDIAEIIVYCSSLTNNDRMNVEKYLDYKYAGPPVCLGEDINILYGFCDTTLKDIFNPARFTAYQWSTGATTSSIKVNETGYYSVTATNAFGRNSVDTVKVNFPKWNLNDTAFCLGQSVVLRSQVGNNYAYSWSTGPTTSAITVSQADTVILTITDTNACFVKDTVEILADSFSVKATLGPDVAFCMGDSLGLLVGELPGNHYLWSTTDTTRKIKVITPGTYSVTVTNYIGCVATDAITVSLKGYSPVMNFSALPVCKGDITNFINSSTVQSPNTINTWDWDFGDGSPHSSSQNPVHTYANSGTYTVTLTATTNVGCVNSITKQVIVYHLPQANFSPVNGCTDVEISFTDKTAFQSGTYNLWSWSFDDPASGVNNTSTIQNPKHTYTTSGTYNVTFTVTSTVGCTDTIVKNVIIRQSPDIDFDYSKVCEGSPVSFTDLTTTSFQWPIQYWHWDFGDGTTDTVFQNPVHLYDSANTYNVSLTVRASSGCIITKTKQLTVNSLPSVKFVSETVCRNNPCQFLDSSTAFNDTINWWKWNFMGIDSSFEKDPVYSFDTLSGFNYNVKLTVRTKAGCENSTQIPVFVYPKPTADFSFSPVYGVAPLSVSFDNLTGGGDYYTWDFGDGSTSALAEPSHIYTSNATYKITLYSTTSFGCIDSVEKEIKVMISSLDIAVIGLRKTIQNNAINLTADLTNAGTRTINNAILSATIDAGTSITENWSGNLATGQVTSYKFSSSFEYIQGNMPKYICVKADMPNGQTDDNMSNNRFCIALTEEFFVTDLYPNPAGDEINFGFIIPSAENVKIILYNAIGEKVKEIFNDVGSKGFNLIKLNTASLAKGMYAVRVTYKDRTDVKSFIKN